MIAFSGFMPASADFTSMVGGKTVDQGNFVDGPADNGEGAWSADETTGSFPDWMQTLMDDKKRDATDADISSDLFVGNSESTLPAFDQLQHLIAEAPDRQMDQPLVARSTFQTGRAGNLDSRQNMASSGIIAAGPNSSVDGQSSIAAGDQPLQASLSSTAKQGDDNSLGEHSLGLSAAKKTPSEGLEKDNLLSTAGDEEPDGFERSIRGRSSAGSERLDKAVETATAHQHFRADQLRNPAIAAGNLTDSDVRGGLDRSVQEQSKTGSGVLENTLKPAPRSTAGQTKAPETLTTALTDQPPDSSQDGMANSRERGNQRPSTRIELADANESLLSQNPSADSVKGAANETAQSRPAFQDSLKPTAMDPTTNMAVKENTGPASASTRPEVAAEKAFQTTVMDQIVDKAAMRSLNGRSEIQIRLKPEFLGNVQMNIASDKDQLVVRILTDQPVVKEIIETHLHHLKTELTNQGLTIDRFDIMVNPDMDQQHSRDQFAQMFKDHSFQNGRRQPREQEPETSHRGDGNPSDDDRPDRDGVNYFA